MTLAFTESNGVSIHYQITGDAGLPALVLSNALGANLAMWEPQVAALAPHFRLLRYDTRGHGNSTLPLEPFTIADLGRDVLHLLDTLEIAQASFCGISMGGLIGQWLGIHTPSRLQKLILSNTAAKIGTEDGWNTRIATVLRDGMPSVIPGTLERWFTADFRSAQPGAVATVESMLQSVDAKAYVANCAAIRDADFRAELHAIRTPSLMIAGIHDQGTTPADGRFLAENIADAAYVESSAAHLSNVEAASEFNAALLNFLQR